MWGAFNHWWNHDATRYTANYVFLFGCLCFVWVKGQKHPIVEGKHMKRETSLPPNRKLELLKASRWMSLATSQNYFLRATPPETLFWHSFWHTIWKYIYGIFILTFFLACTVAFDLTFYLASILTYFLAYILTFFFLHFICHLFWHSIWHLFRHSFWHILHYDILSDILSGILSGIYSDVLSGILFDILSGVWLRSDSAHWDLAPAVELALAVEELRDEEKRRRGEEEKRRRGEEEKRRRGEEGEDEEEATLIKSWDPHLAGGKNRVMKHTRFTSLTQLCRKWRFPKMYPKIINFKSF